MLLVSCLWQSHELLMFYRVRKGTDSSQSDTVTDDSSDKTVSPSSDDESPDKPRRKRRKVRYNTFVTLIRLLDGVYLCNGVRRISQILN